MLVETHESPDVEELRHLGDRIATLAAHIEVATARLLEMIREFDARAGWGDGFLFCAHWLNYRIGLSLHAAREQVRAARALANLPLIAEAFAQGKVSYRGWPHRKRRSACSRSPRTAPPPTSSGSRAPGAGWIVTPSTS